VLASSADRQCLASAAGRFFHAHVEMGPSSSLRLSRIAQAKARSTEITPLSLLQAYRQVSGPRCFPEPGEPSEAHGNILGRRKFRATPRGGAGEPDAVHSSFLRHQFDGCNVPARCHVDRRRTALPDPTLLHVCRLFQICRLPHCRPDTFYSRTFATQHTYAVPAQSYDTYAHPLIIADDPPGALTKMAGSVAARTQHIIVLPHQFVGGSSTATRVGSAAAFSVH
jgi:hypothetical protein